MALLLPTKTDGTERYSFTTLLDGTTYGFEFSWNSRAAFWKLLLRDATGVLLAARRVVIGIPLLSRYRDARLPTGDLVALDTSGADREAGLTDLGTRVQLVYLGVKDIVRDFSIGAAPSVLGLRQGENGESTISTAVTSGRAGTVSLAVTGTPPGATASLNPASVAAGGRSRLTVNAGTAAPGTYAITVKGIEGSAEHSVTVKLTVMPP